MIRLGVQSGSVIVSGVQSGPVIRLGVQSGAAIRLGVAERAVIVSVFRAGGVDRRRREWSRSSRCSEQKGPRLAGSCCCRGRGVLRKSGIGAGVVDRWRLWGQTWGMGSPGFRRDRGAGLGGSAWRLAPAGVSQRLSRGIRRARRGCRAAAFAEAENGDLEGVRGAPSASGRPDGFRLENRTGLVRHRAFVDAAVGRGARYLVYTSF